MSRSLLERNYMSTSVKITLRAVRRLLPAFLLGLILLPSQALAQVDGVHVTITPYAGFTHWDDGVNLRDKPIFGGRLGLMLSRNIGVEANYGYVPAEAIFGPTMYTPRVSVGPEVGADLHHYGGDLLLKLPISSVLTPYLLGGYHQIAYNSDAPVIVEDNTFSGYEVAVGVIGNLSPRVGMRAEVRDVTLSFDSPSALSDGTQNNLFMTLGIQFSLGGRVESDDADGDGVPDDRDTCPGTPLGALVDVNGCPIDGDKDGVPDGLDRCAATPLGAKVDSYGCPLDSDKDGVYDGIDQCANTPSGVTVDARGCPLDADGDGVPDGTDKCPNTPKGATVDLAGCPTDSDSDGVYDGLDRCANTPAGTRVDKDGCPIEVNEKETELLDTGKITVRDIKFETAKWNILPESYRVLDEVGNILIQWPDLRVEIGGHADARGSDAYNHDLSHKRANSVLEYLTGKFPGISTSQYTAKGYGESEPVAPNTTVEGMAKNRRVEFKVLNTEVLKKERERRRTLKLGE